MNRAFVPVVLLAVLLVACGDNRAARTTDAGPPADAVEMHDAEPDAFVPFVRVFGQVIAYGDPVYAATVTTLEGSPQTTTTDPDGMFYFDAPEGSRLIVKVDHVPTGALPMIRGVTARDHLRPRNFYIITADEIAAAGQLGITFDPTTAIVEVDFRNAAVGGYSASLVANNTPLDPAFGIVYDGNGQPQLGEVTLVGGDGSTLLLGGVSPGLATFTPIVPAQASLPCQPRDANPLPLQAGVVTWFDYECGEGED